MRVTEEESQSHRKQSYSQITVKQLLRALQSARLWHPVEWGVCQKSVDFVKLSADVL